MTLNGSLYLCIIILLYADTAIGWWWYWDWNTYDNKIYDKPWQDDYSIYTKPQQCDLTIRQGGYIVEDIATGFGGDSVYLTCDARCKGPGATPALAWYKGDSTKRIRSTRRRVSSYSESSSRVQGLYIRYFRQGDVGRYTCKGWLWPFDWVEKTIWLQMGCAHPKISCDVSRCLPAKYRCDGVRHCQDGFDEYQCGPDSCKESEFYCDGICKDIKIRCDTQPDCHDGLDELDCPEENTWEPDDADFDYNDCENTTETDAITTTETTPEPTTITTTIASGCDTDLYQCHDGSCIPWSWVCDGVEDCQEGDDEWDCWGSTTDPPTTTPAIEPTSPVPEMDCPEEVKMTGHYYDIFNDTCYLFVDELAYWIDADQYCYDMGGELVQIHSMETMEYIKDRLYSDDLGWMNMGVWNGANTLEGDWGWSTGEPLSFSYWGDGEPSYRIGRLASEVCAVMKRSEDWHWQDWHCGLLDWKFQYICQFETSNEDNLTTTTTPAPTTPPNCNPRTQFECWESTSDTFRACIPLPWTCDGRQDCLHGEDEEGCTTPPTTTSVHTTSRCVAENEFECPDRCIPLSWVCDGEPDCEGGSDEFDCETTTEATEWTTATETTTQPTTTEATTQPTTTEATTQPTTTKATTQTTTTETTTQPTTTETTTQPTTTKATTQPTTTKATTQPKTTKATTRPSATETTTQPTTTEATTQPTTTEATTQPTTTETTTQPTTTKTTTQPTTTKSTIQPTTTKATTQPTTTKATTQPTTTKATTQPTTTKARTKTTDVTKQPTTSQSTTMKQAVCGREFNCGNGMCISLSRRCDSIPDCDDERDEQNCPSISCPESNVACADGQQCIAMSQWGDGIYDCKDGSDEKRS